MSVIGLEVLAPAGDPDIFRRVIDAGADAVYFGGHAFGARAYATNFTLENAASSIHYAHARGKKAYLTVNTLLKNVEIERDLYDYLKSYYQMGLDAVIVQDYGVFTMVRDYFPEMAIHCSTQMSLSTPYGAKFLQEQGAHRIVTAREISIAEIADIYEKTGIEIETFVHGALCICYSGQCLMSSVIGGRSGNRGRCAQPCRLPYEAYDTNHKRLPLPGNYTLSPKDLCGIRDIPKLSEAGVYSLKIEGRMKQGDYAEGVVAMYRKYVDRYLRDGADGYRVDQQDMDTLMGLGNRGGFTNAYYYKRNDTELMSFSDSSHHNGKLSTTGERKVKIQLLIAGNFTASQGRSMKLVVRTLDGLHEVEVTGDAPEAAKNQGATKENIEEKLRKTGNSPYVFQELSISCEDGLFIPGSILNDMRRRALEALEDELTAIHRSPERSFTKTEEAFGAAEEIQCFVTLRDTSLLSLILEKDYVTHVGLDTSITFTEDAHALVEHIHGAGKQAVCLMPMIYRANSYTNVSKIMGAGFDAYVATTMDALGYLLEHVEPGRIILDQKLYTYSNRSEHAYRKLGVLWNTVPYELNAKELRHRYNKNSYLTVYGYMPLMYMANCTHKNACGCDHKPQKTILVDRKDNAFTMVNACEICTNVLYNYLPTNLMGEVEIRDLGTNAYRLDFTIESKTVAEEILTQFEAMPAVNSTREFTRGHYRRGVE